MDEHNPTSAAREPPPDARPFWRRLPLAPQDRAQADAERKAQRAIEDQQARARIVGGRDLRQPPEYRGRVFEHADHDGVHPSAFPPYRWDPQEGLTEEFIAFQHHGSPTYETHPEYFCPSCTIRYNGRNGGRCGPCLGELAREAARVTPLFPDVPLQPSLPEYPD